MKKVNLGKVWGEQKKVIIGIAGTIVLVSCIAIGLYANREQVTQKATDFDINVNTDVDTDIFKYLDGVKNPDQATADWDKVDIKKIGDYQVTIKYKDNDYKVKFHVADKEKPILKLSKTDFEFALNTSLDDINIAINETVTITDNYDKEFEPIKAVTELPKETGEQTYNLSVQDKAKNVSDKVQIKVNYTEPKEEEQEEPQENYAQQGDTGTTQGGYTPQAPANNTPTPTPEPQAPVTPTPTPEPQAPVEQPSNNGSGVVKVEVNIPAGALDGGLFNSFEEALAWSAQYDEDPNSQWYHHSLNCMTIETGQERCYIEP